MLCAGGSEGQPGPPDPHHRWDYSVPKAGGRKAKEAKANLWRVNSAFDLPGERFQLTLN